MMGNENVQALFEMGKINEPTDEAALLFCKKSNIGKYLCSVQTRYGWCCDLCLEEELMELYSKGVHTVNSCCGHGAEELASILVVGENSKEKMFELGYMFLREIGSRITMWKPKSKMIYCDAKMDGTDEQEG